jgi:putative MATE family efflux protein
MKQDRMLKGMLKMNPILEGPLFKNIFLFAMPIAATSILQQLFNSADTAVVGRFADMEALAAVGINAEVVALLVSLSTGLAVGCNVILAWAIGRKEFGRIRGVMHSGLVLAVLAGLCLMGLSFLLAEPLLRIMETPAEIFDKALLYLRIYAAGLPFLLLYDFGSAIERARGNSKRPLYALIASGVLNVVLNLLLVIVFHLGVAGVAIATDISTAASASLTLFWLSREKGEFRFAFRYLCFQKDIVLGILRIGIPAGVQSAVFCLANLFVQWSINRFGAVAVAGVTVSLNFEYLTYYMIMAFAQTATTFTSQNAAAGERKRCQKILWISLLQGFVLSALISTPAALAYRYFAGIYSDDPAVIEMAGLRMRLLLFLTPISTFYEVPAGVLRGHGLSVLPAAETIMGICILRICWIFFVLPSYQTLFMLFIVFPISWVVTTIMMWGSILYLHHSLSYQSTGQTSLEALKL